MDRQSPGLLGQVIEAASNLASRRGYQPIKDPRADLLFSGIEPAHHPVQMRPDDFLRSTESLQSAEAEGTGIGSHLLIPQPR